MKRYVYGAAALGVVFALGYGILNKIEYNRSLDNKRAELASTKDPLEEKEPNIAGLALRTARNSNERMKALELGMDARLKGKGTQAKVAEIGALVREAEKIWGDVHRTTSDLIKNPNRSAEDITELMSSGKLK
jgi:hypothetical protein